MGYSRALKLILANIRPFDRLSLLFTVTIICSVSIESAIISRDRIRINSKSMKLIVGLGNPGKTYAHNRHNAGFRCLNYFARLHSIRFDHRRCRARIGIAEVGDEKLLLAKPGTFMNLSGQSVACLVHKYDIPSSDLLVIYDDLDLPLGKIRLRQSGSSGGHKGMNSIISALGSEDFPRIRVGIDRPQMDEQSISDNAIVNYVLSDFSPQEEAIIKPVIAGVAEAIDCFLTQGIEAAMSKFN
jgi:PTH1 family peptidyl-tRNA hydrolase